VLFNSFSYLVFFPLVVLLHFLTPYRHRWAALLAASCLFYMAFIPSYILILFLVVGVDYAAGLGIEAAGDPRRKKLFLWLSLGINVGILCFFKYIHSVAAAFLGTATSSFLVNIVLPLGLSFHTFQSMSYTIEVFRGNQKAERHLGIFALYVLFFPQLVAGPIERPQNLLPQLRLARDFDPAGAVEGLRRLLWGMFKKVVVADRLAVLVDQAYARPEAQSGAVLAAATFFFAFQIYCDFSGYSDIAVGSARVLGVRLMENFDRPYAAPNIREFWRRWHVSLSSFFRDYVYRPLGGNRGGPLRWGRNVLATFFLSGVWHGAGWNFAVWGLYHGLLVILSGLPGLLRPGRRATALPSLRRAAGTAATFAAVCAGWVFFRAQNLGEAWLILKRMAAGLLEDGALSVLTVPARMYVGLWTSPEIRLAVSAVVFVQAIEWAGKNETARELWERSAVVRWAGYAAVVAAVLNLGTLKEIPFIYFQF